MDAAGAAGLEERFDIGGGGQVEVAVDAVLEAARGDGEVDGLLGGAAADERMDQPGAEGVAPADSVDDVRDVVRRPDLHGPGGGESPCGGWGLWARLWGACVEDAWGDCLPPRATWGETWRG